MIEMTHVNPGSGNRDREKTGFFIDTQDHCFLCSNQITSPESGTITPPHSLRYLSRYLRLNLRKVFSKEVNLPPQVVAKLEKGILGARLCEECALLNDKFSELCGQLERIEMEVGHCLEKIHGRMVKAEEGCRRSNSLEHNLTLQIAEALRKQTIEKCSQKLTMSRSQPRVLLSKLSMDTNTATNVSICKDTDTNEPVASTIELVHASNIPVEREGIRVDLNLDEKDTHDLNNAPRTPHNKQSDTPSPHSNDADPNEDSVAVVPMVELVTESSIPVKGEGLQISSNLDSGNTDGRDPDPDEFSDAPPDDTDPLASMECDICQIQVYDLSTHLYTAHFDLEKELNEVAVEEPEPAKLPKSLKLPQNIVDQHCSFNPATGRHECQLCSRQYTRMDHWSRHYKNVHLNIRHRCLVCGKQFNEPFGLRNHHKTAHLGMRFRCRTCGKVYSQRICTMTHQRNSRGACKVGQNEVEVVQLPKIGKNKKERTLLPEHQHIAGKASGHRKLQIPHKELSSQSAFHSHFTGIHNNVGHRSLECGRGFARETNLRRHLQLDTVHVHHRAKLQEQPEPARLVEDEGFHSTPTPTTLSLPCPLDQDGPPKCDICHLQISDHSSHLCLAPSRVEQEEREAMVSLPEPVTMPQPPPGRNNMFNNITYYYYT